MFRFRRKPPPQESPEPTFQSELRSVMVQLLTDRLALLPQPIHLVDLAEDCDPDFLRLLQVFPNLHLTSFVSTTDSAREATHAALQANLGARAHFERSDLISLSLPDETADLVTGISLLASLPSPQGLLGELARILRPEGHALLLEPLRPGQTTTDFRIHFDRHLQQSPFRDFATVTEIPDAPGGVLLELAC